MGRAHLLGDQHGRLATACNLFRAAARAARWRASGPSWLGWDPEAGERREGFAAARAAAAARGAGGGAAPLRLPRHAEAAVPPGRGAAARTSSTPPRAAVAAGCARFELRLQVAALGGFLALVPEEAPPALAALEEALVTGLDAFRAPADAAETVRRRMAGLDAVEEENLRRWGYPYVLRRFRFHMTLTGPLPAEARARGAGGAGAGAGGGAGRAGAGGGGLPLRRGRGRGVPAGQAVSARG